MKLILRTFAMTAISALMLCACSQTRLAESPGPALSTKPTQPTQPTRIILVGDSTMAPKSGYGDALCARFKPEVTCLNLAKGGRSSGSYRAEGSWEVVQKLMANNAQFSQTLVLIQFGHNDQPGKPGRSTDLATEFPVNMAGYVNDVQAAGAQAVLVTPLTRRSFKGTQLQNDLRPWADASMKVADAKHVPMIDLNAISYSSVQAMGEAEADTLAMAPPPAALPADTGDLAKTERAGAAKSAFDRTHLGSKGAAHFSAMVLKELLLIAPNLQAHVNAGNR
ncbi:rhamnogalacturonan acetylesterase [Undibacterium sp. Tian12W]|uniref:rhamnogalacturonan acetylesterase n=1 Tax=Undibacterium sp. Tian12W TaxID=3413054 RepID=UPI003BF26023